MFTRTIIVNHYKFSGFYYKINLQKKWEKLQNKQRLDKESLKCSIMYTPHQCWKTL